MSTRLSRPPQTVRPQVRGALVAALCLVLGLIVPIAPFDSSADAARITDLVVCPSCPVASIKQAIRQASPGARIVVRGGVYREGNIVIDKQLEIAGEGWPVLDGENKWEVITVKADGVRIRGLVVQNSGTSFTEDLAGIKVDSVGRCVIENNRLFNDFFAIYLAAADDCIIRGNDVHGNATTEAFSGNAIHLWNSNRVLVESNRVRGHRDGLYLEFASAGTIRGNLSENNLRYGLHTMYSESNEYLGNVVRANRGGVVLMYSKHLSVNGNKFAHNWGPACYGALLKDLDDSRLVNNVFERNSVGLYAENSNRMVVKRNEFADNGFAVRIMADSMDNEFSNNSFAGNTFDVATNSSETSPNSFAGNYWSQYQGYDLDGDGIGDVPYHPVRLSALLLEQYPPAMILLRSPFVELLDMAERAIPVFTPRALVDSRPLMRRPNWSKSEISKSASAR